MSDLKEKLTLEELVSPSSSAPADEGYEAWKIAKIRTALEESKDRSCVIPLDDVWKRFGFER
ncbi:hypothetical protein EPK99_09435 [Neorhizobium lilium]|uniref:Uncharacterized protein n=1 Tax=Neorhizobium lilium TaxID=2503024 RepID=A0A444LIE6_9HYPH|nr:hypothetical protein [Neorhizobium lilium]RWX78798.1 hypothetical protein EPK99_09435 [Neorhizobium lilium]